MIAIIDYGMSNLGSIYRAVEECGGLDVKIVTDPKDLRSCDRMILPGVGSFKEGMKNLVDGGWVEVIQEEVIKNKIPILGICLGMQLLASVGFEGGKTFGLDLVAGEVRQLVPSTEKEKSLHVGWNEVNLIKPSVLFEGIENGRDFYFVHSYHFIPKNKEHIVAITPYCNEVISVINNNNIFGTQFHPEKSIPSGFILLKNFINY